eukprot:695803_1
MSSLRFALISLLFVLNATTATNIGTSVLLSDAAYRYGAVCLDGSPANYYFAPGEQSTKYVIFFQGGGWCFNEADCWSRANSSLGSTTKDPTTQDFNKIGFLGNDSSSNPLFYNWNRIYVRYCDGMSLAGDLTEPVVDVRNSSRLMYYRGKRILDAVFESLLSDYGVNQASDFVISGGSAGSLAVFIHTNYITNTFFDLKKTKVVSMPDVGFFIEYNGYNGETQWANRMEYIYKMQNVSMGSDECLFPQNIAGDLIVPTFVLNSQYDSYQAESILGTGTSNATLLNEYGKNFTSILLNKYLAKNTVNGNIYGAYIDSCYHHGAGQPIWWSGLHIDGYTQATAFMQFYQGLGQENNRVFWYQNATYPCDACCPTKVDKYLFHTTDFGW